MTGLRATALTWVFVAATALAGACMPMEEPRFTADVERELERGREFSGWVAAHPDPGPSELIAAGYLERLRLGLGSPFRLTEYALQDPRLERAERDRVAWALLAATVDGSGFRVDPRALAPTGDGDASIRHLELVEGAIMGSPDPDAGVLAVRLAYAMAEAEQSVAPRLPSRVAQAAALIRDRAVSKEDARRLLRAAGRDRDPLSLLVVWRVERRFRVEAPAVLAVGSTAERDAIVLAPRLLDGIRSIGDRPRVGPVIRATEARHQSLLSPIAAERLAAETELYDYPPQTPIVVALGTFRGGGSTAAALARDQFFTNATNEERLAAEYAILQHAGAVDAGSRLGVMAAAVSLRAYAQERPWFPGFEGPARRDLEDRFGIAAIEFPDAVPPHWRPYYRRMLESSLSDLRRVLPSLEVKGLRIRVQPRDGSPGTLAVHDPRTRTMYLPAATGAGTIAHEIAHDLDWQTALRRYNVRGDYATDRAVREADSRLARVMLGLTAASITPSAVGQPHDAHATRPAEVFARSLDWFAAVALAQEGRINGYLSSVQDDLLTGYGTVNPPDVTGAAGQALIAILDEVAPVYPETRRWFLQSYGQLRSPTAFDLARRILEAPLTVDGVPEILTTDWAGELREQGEEHDADADADAEAHAERMRYKLPQPSLVRLATALARLERLESARDTLTDLLVGGCGTVGGEDRIAGPRRDLIAMVAAARARGIALTVGEEVAGADGRRWVDSQLRGRSAGVEISPAAAEALLPVVERARGVSGTRVTSPRLGFPTQPTDCSAIVIE
jgi:hypothetical protein